MRILVLCSLVFSGCILDGGRHGEPVFKEKPLQNFIQIGVIADLAIDSGNPEVTVPRYRYHSLEAFDVTGLTLATGLAAHGTVPLAASTGPQGGAFSWPAERDLALKHARADVLRRIGTCARLDAPVAEIEGNLFIERKAVVTTSTDLELDDIQLAGLCNGGDLP